MNHDLLTQTEVAKKCGIPRQRLYRLIKSGKVKLYGGNGLRGLSAGRVKIPEVIRALKLPDKNGRPKNRSKHEQSGFYQAACFIKDSGYNPLSVANYFLDAAMRRIDTDILASGIRYIVTRNKYFLNALCDPNFLEIYIKQEFQEQVVYQKNKKPMYLGLDHEIFTAFAITRNQKDITAATTSKSFLELWGIIAYQIWKQTPINVVISDTQPPYWIPCYHLTPIKYDGHLYFSRGESQKSILMPPTISKQLNVILLVFDKLKMKVRRDNLYMDRMGHEIETIYQYIRAAIWAYQQSGREQSGAYKTFSVGKDHRPNLINNISERTKSLDRLRQYGLNIYQIRQLYYYCFVRTMEGQPRKRRPSLTSISSLFGVSRRTLCNNRWFKAPTKNSANKDEIDEVVCTRCGTKSPPGTEICPQCGHDFTMDIELANAAGETKRKEEHIIQ